MIRGNSPDIYHQALTRPLLFLNLTSLHIPSAQRAPNMTDPVQLITLTSPDNQSAHRSITSAASTAARSLHRPLVRKRRNGLQPACGPCRKAKVRCETSPPRSLCSRCTKMRTSSHCIFLNAPMTRQFRGPSSEPGLSLPTPQSPSRSSYAVAGLSPSTSIATIMSPAVVRKVSGPSGFLCLTSFSATLRDYEVEVTDDVAESDPGNNIQQDPIQIAVGVSVLGLLPDRSDCQTLISHFLDSPGSYACKSPWCRSFFESLTPSFKFT
jgi:hypothetical protein